MAYEYNKRKRKKVVFPKQIFFLNCRIFYNSWYYFNFHLKLKFLYFDILEFLMTISHKFRKFTKYTENSIGNSKINKTGFVIYSSKIPVNFRYYRKFTKMDIPAQPIFGKYIHNLLLKTSLSTLYTCFTKKYFNQH